MYKVTISNLFIGGKKYRNGDLVDISEDEAAKHSTRLEYVEVKQEPEPPKKRGRRKKSEGSGEVQGQPRRDVHDSEHLPESTLFGDS
jgi:hypothetical protein